MASRIDPEIVFRQFHRTVNIPPDDLRRWLRTEASRRAAGQAGRQTPPVARRIIALRTRPLERLTYEDVRTMAEVVRKVRRRATRVPARPDRLESRWRHALMNLGHDPLKDRYDD
jgi:hypothetical protein